jgi:GntR family transcriptional regulator/MocR family aminotransferase
MKNFNLLWWKIKEPLDRNPGYQLQEFIIHNITSIGLGEGEKLPSQRDFATLNKVNVKTVKRVYLTLTATGWIRSVPGSGTFVARESARQKQNLISKGFVEQLPVALPKPVDARSGNSAIRQNFMTVGVDTLGPAFFPLASLLKHMKYYQRKYGTATQIQQVTDLLGLEFREAVRKYFKDIYAFRLDPGTIDISFGRAGSLKHILALLLVNGDEMINTTPQDLVLAEVLGELEVNQHSLNSSDPDFIANLETLLQTTSIKVLYVRSQCSYPEGTFLTAETCTKILELAKEYHFYILEEDEYHEFWYKELPHKPLARYDHEGHVIYMGVLSQLSVYMRNTMVICACKEFIDLFRAAPKNTYSYRNLIEEKAITDMLGSGELWRRVKIANEVKAEERTKLIFALDGILGDFSQIGRSSSGLSLWIIFPETVNLQDEMQFLGRRKVEVPFDPSAKVPDVQCHHMRLGFGTFNEDEALAAAKLLRKRFENL